MTRNYLQKFPVNQVIVNNIWPNNFVLCRPFSNGLIGYFYTIILCQYVEIDGIIYAPVIVKPDGGRGGEHSLYVGALTSQLITHGGDISLYGCFNRLSDIANKLPI